MPLQSYYPCQVIFTYRGLDENLEYRIRNHTPIYAQVLTILLKISASPKAGVSPQPSKLAKPLTTLVEEQHVREAKPLLDRDDDMRELYCCRLIFIRK